MSNILVTGCTGFIGTSVILELLANSINVICLLRESNKLQILSDESINYRVGEISKSSLVSATEKKILQAIIHCAGSSSVSRSFHFPYDDFVDSVVTVATVLEYIRTIDASIRPRLVLLSSAAVYGNNSGSPLLEHASLCPSSPYGANKVLLENLARHYHEFFKLHISIIRPFSIYGNGHIKQLLWDACVKFTQGNNMFFGTGEEKRDWLHVYDLSNLLRLAATVQEQSDFEIYNAGGSHMSVREILTRLSYYLGVGLEPEFEGREHLGNPQHLISDSNKAAEVLGWKPVVNIDKGIEQYTQWFRRNYSK